ncbi:efflux RND transporter periplasmic adaptor subunit [Shinella zoogloeoides]|uniref:Efflux RND transporter periplasmic adaptor subunit n=1 Tax=Shinella zoogloeoides TaxID=352475 RepID=A0A6N8TEY8_SHIZO|nr:efflux RND transporter periplasmic adaptor subunit [Shinella zoogloeoides]MXO00975.1 efflux RND transporter periplasmic adaptor subunit [Shinella zoogloeoides]UEX80502.1 efflux RND transporter periplasmic adaptor subunit [Shinella zoogloeoides]
MTRSGRMMLAALLLSATAAPALADGMARPVRTAPVHFEEREQSITITGEVIARVETDLSFRVGGRIVGWFVDVGDAVREGEVLARLDPEEQKADVEAAEAGVRAAEAQLKLARTNFDRQKSLLHDGISTQRDYDDAETALRTAESAREASVAQRDTAQEVLSYTELRAPADGIVTARLAETGQVAQAAQTMFTIADNGPRDAVFNVYESLFFAQPSKDGVTVTLLSDETVRATGHVREVSPTIDAQTGTVRVKIAMDETPPQMTLGASVVGVGALAPRRVAVVPWQALSGVEGKPALWIVDKANNTVSLRPVEVLSFETGAALVSGGIEEGEVYVADGTKLLRPGQTVSASAGEAQ